MKLSNKSKVLIDQVVSDIVTHYSDLEDNVITDIHFQPLFDSGELKVFDDDDDVISSAVISEFEGLGGSDAVKDVCGRLPELEGVEVGFKVAEFGKSAAISIRSRSFDVSEIARQYGGGGHKNAAAFQIPGNGKSINETVAEFVKNLEEKLIAEGK